MRTKRTKKLPLTASFIKVILVLIASGLVSACGYQLKGHHVSSLAGKKLYIASDNPFGKFEKALKRRLNATGARLTVGENSAFSVNLLAIESMEQGVSRDATGRASEAILTTSLKFQVIKLNTSPSDEAVTIQELTESTNYAFSYRDPVARKNQKKEAQDWLHQKLIERLVRRLERQITVL